MDLEGSAMTLNERKVVRRGLLAGLAALGAAAVMKLSGVEKAQAADGDFLKIGNTLGPTAGQDGSSETRLTTSPADGPAFQVNNNHAPVFNRSAITGAMSGTATSGVYGHNTSSDGYGVLGGNFTGIGVAGVGEPGVQGMAPLVGVQGYGTGGSGNGVRGAATNNGTGIRGVSNAGGSQAADGNGSGIGVLGKSTNGPGVQGNSISSLGVRGLSSNFVGVVGISDTSHGLYGSTSNPAASGLVGENLSGGVAGFFQGNVQIYGSLQVFGAPKNAILKMQDGTFASVYCQESPEPYFEDFGKAQLAGGVANVPLEREFATLVAAGEYLVFLTPEGDTRGLFVSRKSPGGFEVREVQGGTGNVSFTYRIVTKRKDIEGKRFARVDTSAAEKVSGVRAVLAAMGSSGPAAGPSAPLPTHQPASPSFTNTLPGVSGGPGSTIFTNTLPGVPGGPGSNVMPPASGASGAPPSTGG